MSKPPNAASSIWRAIRLAVLLASVSVRPCCAAPVSAAKTGFTQDQISSIRSNWTWQTLFTPGDATVYATLHFSDFYPSATIHHSGPTVPLESSPDPAIPRTKWHTALGDLTLAEYIAHPGPRTQAYIVVRHGKIVYAKEYSSVNSQVLVMLAEEIDHHPWPEIFASRVYSKLSAEADAGVMLSPDRVAVPCGFISMRLRDLVRFGLLFTPSWHCASREQIVTPAMLRSFQTLPDPLLKFHTPTGDEPSRNNRQWDNVADTGVLFKSGMFGQGLFVSPRNDLVIAWFSTSDTTGILGYCHAIAAKGD